MTAPKHVRRIDVHGLEAALHALLRHQELIDAALADSGGQPSDAARVRQALRRIVDDGYRSRETRGGS